MKIDRSSIDGLGKNNWSHRLVVKWFNNFSNNILIWLVIDGLIYRKRSLLSCGLICLLSGQILLPVVINIKVIYTWFCCSLLFNLFASYLELCALFLKKKKRKKNKILPLPGRSSFAFASFESSKTACTGDIRKRMSDKYIIGKDTWFLCVLSCYVCSTMFYS